MKNFYEIYLCMFFLINNNVGLAQWEQVNKDFNGRVSSFIINNNVLYASAFEEGIFYSTDFGYTWSTINPPNLHVLSIDVLDQKIIAGTWDGIYYSSDNGTNWNLINSELNYPNITSIKLMITENVILVGTNGRGIYVTSNQGLNWDNIKPGFDTCCTDIKAFIKINDFLLTAVYREGIFISSDKGANWESSNEGLTDKNVTCFTRNDSIIYAGTDNGGGLFYSSDNAKSWESLWQIGLVDRFFISLSIVDTNLFASSYSTIYHTTDNGNFWQMVKTNSISDPPVHEHQFYCIIIFADYLFAGTSHGIWRCPLSLTTSVKNVEGSSYISYNLFQNYPNPFNPSTTIRYQIPQRSFVTLKVYDLLGREVVTLVNEEKPAGSYEVEFSAQGRSTSGEGASELSSGVYFYKLEAGEFANVKKFILIR